MPKKHRKFADDGWAVWIDGDDTSTIHINDWLNPKGKSYVDIAIHIRGIKLCKSLNVYVPFPVSYEEIGDVSLSFGDTKILQAIFSAACIVDYKKNQHTSEIAYNGKTVDIVHISTMSFEAVPLSNGTLIRIDLQGLQSFLDNDEAGLKAFSQLAQALEMTDVSISEMTGLYDSYKDLNEMLVKTRTHFNT